jgi:uncharacterized protein with FMN-binding domain
MGVKMKVFPRIILVVVAVIVLAAAGGIFYITRGLNTGAKVEINNVDLAMVEDGIYDGKYSSGRWTNELNVIVKEHKITDIKVIKDVTFSNAASAQQLFDKVIEKQKVDVDAVSGATVTSKAYQKSIENALSK